MLSTLANALKLAFNRANVGTLPAAFQSIALGDVLRYLPTQIYNGVPSASGDPYVSSTAGALYLPDDAKAMTILRAYARSGTGTTGALTIDADTATAPSAGHCSISPSGDIQFASADAWTSVDVFYLPHHVDVIEVTLPVVPGTGVCTLPTVQNASPALYVVLMEAQALAGTTVGTERIQAPGATPATGQAAFNTAKSQVQFYTGDAVTSARVKLGIAPKVNLNSLLEAASQLI